MIKKKASYVKMPSSTGTAMIDKNETVKNEPLQIYLAIKHSVDNAVGVEK